MPAFNGIAYPTAGTEIGVAVETTRGTAVPPAFWIPVKSPKYKPNLMLIEDDTLQGSMVKTYDLVTGIRYDGHGWNAPPYLDNFPVLLRAEFGSTDNLTAAPGATTLSSAAIAGATTISTAASIPANSWIVLGSAANGTLETHKTTAVSGAGPFTVTLFEPLIYGQANSSAVTGLTKHQFSLLNNSQATGNQPPSLTLTDFSGEEWRQITAAQIDELTIKGNGTGLVDYTCTFFGNPATTPSTPTPSFTGIQTPAPWTFYSSIGGTYTPTVIDWEFNFKRSTKPIPALTGQQAYFAYWADVLTADGKLTFVEQSGSPELVNFLNAIRQSLDFTLFDMKTGSAFNLHGSNGQFKTGEIDRSKEYVTVPVEFTLLPSVTDALAGGVSPCILTVANAQTTSY